MTWPVAGGLRAVVMGLLAAVVPCASLLVWRRGEGLVPAAHVAVAALLEAGVVTAFLRRRAALVEAWLCAGARPLEIVARARPRVRPSIVVAAAYLVPLIARPSSAVGPADVATLIAIGVATITAAVIATHAACVDHRLVDRPPPESRTPFRLKPPEAAPRPRVYDTRPGRKRT